MANNKDMADLLDLYAPQRKFSLSEDETENVGNLMRHAAIAIREQVEEIERLRKAIEENDGLLEATKEGAAIRIADLERKLADVAEHLIHMKRYVIHHGNGIGECVAWNKLKAMFGTDRDYAGRAAKECWTQQE